MRHVKRPCRFRTRFGRAGGGKVTHIVKRCTAHFVTWDIPERRRDQWVLVEWFCGNTTSNAFTAKGPVTCARCRKALLAKYGVKRWWELRRLAEIGEVLAALKGTS